VVRVDDLNAVYDDYTVDPSLARLRSERAPLYPMGHPTGTMELCVLADNDVSVTEEDWANIWEVFSEYNPRLTHVIKFSRATPRPAEWQAAKALVAREVSLTKPRAWVPVGPVSCELLGVSPWIPAVAGVQVDYSKAGAPIVQGRWHTILATLYVLLDEEAGFVSRG
jgi:hypothetical protein